MAKVVFLPPYRSRAISGFTCKTQREGGEGNGRGRRNREQERKENFSRSPFPFACALDKFPQRYVRACTVFDPLPRHLFCRGSNMCKRAPTYLLFTHAAPSVQGGMKYDEDDRLIRGCQQPEHNRAGFLPPSLLPSFCGRTPNFAALRLAGLNRGRTHPAATADGPRFLFSGTIDLLAPTLSSLNRCP